MNQKVKTIAIIVTYNRCKLLERCIINIQNQTTKVDEILVINNGSTDATGELLSKMKIRNILQENLGSAGGWKRGLQFALENNFDAAWLMDDDGFPALDSLTNLKSVFTEEKACVSSVVIQEDNHNKFVFPLPILSKKGLPKIISFPRKIHTIDQYNELIGSKMYPFTHLFNGALISLEAVRKVGNVNSEYYLYGDEVDYFFRLKRYGQVLSVLNSFHFHPNVTKRKFSRLTMYYSIKNSLIINNLYFNKVAIRNILSIGIILLRVAKRNGTKELFSLLFGEQNYIFYQAILNGLKGKIGKDFDT